MRKLASMTLCVFALLALAAAQTDQAKKPAAAPAKKAAAPAKKAPAAGAPQMPQPAPELKRLAYFAGDWTSAGTLEASAFGPAGKFSGKEHNEWFAGKFFLVSRGDTSMGGMPIRELAVFGYDADKKMYTYHAVNSMGEAEDSAGTVNGADWTWTNDSTMKGKTYKNKFTIHEDSPTAYSMKFDMSDDGGATWKTVMEGKVTKAAKAAPGTETKK